VIIEHTERHLVYVRKFEWLTTALNPLLPGYSEPRGWKCHAVLLNGDNGGKAACGMRAAHGYAMDLFIEKKCARCLIVLGLACKACRGTGANGLRPCFDCLMTGECKAFREQQKNVRRSR